jgi:hypothetical protein
MADKHVPVDFSLCARRIFRYLAHKESVQYYNILYSRISSHQKRQQGCPVAGEATSRYTL